VAQDEQLNFFARWCAAQQQQPAQKPIKDQVEEA
jgi:hypothetical protein